MKETAANPGLQDICESDKLISMFAKSLIGRVETARQKDLDNVRGKWRYVARIYRKALENDSCLGTKPLSSFISGGGFNKIVAAVQDITLECGPAFALRVGGYIKHLGLLWWYHGIEEEDAVARTN